MQQPKSAWVTFTVACMASAALLAAVPAGDGHPVAFDFRNVVGPRACTECHEAETQIWRETDHHLKAELLPRNERAKEIAKALGIRRIKVDERCARCHFTLQQKPDERPKAIAGISCESCHGPAGGWLDAHADFGGKAKKITEETPEHRLERLALCDAAGMGRPGQLYRLGASCYGCHTVDDEEIVNVGGHPVTVPFEFVAWSQGAIRHNFVRGAGQTNVPSSLERRRLMYVLGLGLDLEYALGALASSSGSGVYADAETAHVTRAVEALQRLQGQVPIEVVAAMLAAVDGVALLPGATRELERAAQAVGAAARELESDSALLDLSALDALLPGADPSTR